MMEVSVIQIGNSKGIRFSKTMMEKYKIRDSVKITLEEDCMVIKPVYTPRKGWDNAFASMHKNGDDQLLIPDVFDDENPEEWT
jgi:antitoxin MazE